MLTGIAIVLFVMDWRLAIVALSVLPLIAAVTQWFRRHARQSYREVRGWISPHQRLPAGERHRDGDRAVVPARGAAVRTVRRHQPGVPGRAPRIHLFLRGVSIPPSRCWGRWPWPRSSGSAARGRSRAASSSGPWWRSCCTRSASSARSAICPRSSTSCRRRWRRPSGSSGCSTPRWRSPTPPRRPPRCGSACGMTGEITRCGRGLCAPGRRGAEAAAAWRDRSRHAGRRLRRFGRRGAGAPAERRPRSRRSGYRPPPAGPCGAAAPGR